MEEDIKIIEDYIKSSREFEKKVSLEEIFEGIQWKRRIQAIENLLKRYKELEEMLKNRIKYTRELEQDLFENARNYVIPISVIQNKIDEIQESMNKANPSDLYYIEYCEDRIIVLKELLNERK